jgi:hypothetical protein
MSLVIRVRLQRSETRIGRDGRCGSDRAAPHGPVISVKRRFRWPCEWRRRFDFERSIEKHFSALALARPSAG